MDFTSKLIIGGAITVSTALFSLAIVIAVIIRLPEDYFHDRKQRGDVDLRHPAVRLLAIVGKNVLGLILILLGLVLSVPGVPGQGILTMFLGLLLMDFPGKYRIERAIMRWPRVLKTVNRLRGRYGKPAFDVSPRVRSG